MWKPRQATAIVRDHSHDKVDKSRLIIDRQANRIGKTLLSTEHNKAERSTKGTGKQMPILMPKPSREALARQNVRSNA